MLLPSPPSITPGGAVHRCTESALPLQFQTLNPPHANETEIPDPQIESQGRTPQRPSRLAGRRTSLLRPAHAIQRG